MNEKVKLGLAYVLVGGVSGIMGALVLSKDYLSPLTDAHASYSDMNHDGIEDIVLDMDPSESYPDTRDLLIFYCHQSEPEKYQCFQKNNFAQ